MKDISRYDAVAKERGDAPGRNRQQDIQTKT